MWTTRLLGIAGLIAATVSVGCELQEITVVDVGQVVLAEVYVEIAAAPADNRVRAYLHWTVGTAGTDASLRASTVTLMRSGGASFQLSPTTIDECVASEIPDVETGVCFSADPSDTAPLRPGDQLEVRIDLSGGGTVRGVTRVPGAFEVSGISVVCRLEPDSLMPVSWSRSEGAWAYLNEASISGLPEALAPEGIVVEEDPLFLLGLSVSDADTTIVFPSEFGVFDRFTLDSDLSVRLQRGLPAVTRTEVTIAAIDRNYVNWVRGGNFNPSGLVRLPSLQGDGTGVFGSAVVRSFDVLVTEDLTTGALACPSEEAP